MQYNRELAAVNKIAIIQARMGSTRLPGKVLKDIAGKPMLLRVLERVSLAAQLDDILVAATSYAADDPLAVFCHEQGYQCFRGSQFDVLDRFYQAALQVQAGTVVRITADCPLIDPSLLDQLLDEFEKFDVDFAANRLPPPFKRSFPIGLDIEICKFSALDRAWNEADQPHQREHVMPYLYEDTLLKTVDSTHSIGTGTRGFKTLLLDHLPDLGELRWTVDTPQDMAFIRKVFNHFPGRIDFSWLEVLDLVRSNPDLALINTGIHHKSLLDIDERNKQG
ncbi:cytidylyltransferase domain-containing protein [Chloroflexota bacterium]